MNKLLLSILLLLLVLSCNSGNETKIAEEPFVVNPKTEEVLKMSDFVNSVSYINLEISDDRKSIVDMVSTIYGDEGNIFVVGGGAITMFDQNGKYIRRIGQKGRGHGEYIAAEATTIDTVNNRIILFDPQNKKLFYYSYGGEFIKNVELESSSYVRDIEYIYPTGNILCAEYMHEPKSSGKTELWEIDSLGNTVNELFVSDYSHPTCSPTFVLHRNSNDEIIYSALDDLSDYLYKDGKITKITSYDVKGKTANDLKGLSNMELSKQYWNYNKNLNFRAETIMRGDYEFTNWMGEVLGENYYTLVNKRTNKMSIGKTMDLKLENSQVIIPSRIPLNEDITIMKTNMIDVIPVALYVNNITDAQMLKQLGMTEEEAMNANMSIQFLHLKK